MEDGLTLFVISIVLAAGLCAVAGVLAGLFLDRRFPLPDEDAVRRARHGADAQRSHASRDPLSGLRAPEPRDRDDFERRARALRRIR